MDKYSGDKSVTSEDISKDVLAKQCVVRIVDDDPSVLKSYQFMLRTAGWFCSTFENAEEFLSKDVPDPGCLILDVRMPGLSGLQLQQKLEILERDIPIIFVTGHGDVEMAVQTLKRGAQDFLLKPVDPVRLKESVYRCCLLDFNRFLKVKQEAQECKKVESLSNREVEVANLLAKGLLYKQIADKLGCSERTIKYHKARIAEKLGVRTSVEIVMKLKDTLY